MFAIEESRSDYDVGARFLQLLSHYGDIGGKVLAVRVELDDGVVAISQGILHSGAECGGESGVYGEVDTI